MLESVTVHVDATREVTERFGTLKAVLGAIPARYANFQVSLWPFTRCSSLTSVSAGSRRHREQDRRPPLTYSCSGRTFRFASK